MADLVSAAASIIAVLQLSYSVISTCWDYGVGVKNAHKDADRVRHAVQDLQTVLESLLDLVQKNESPSITRVEILVKLTEPGGSLEVCKSILEDITKSVRPRIGWKAARDALIWPLHGEHLRARLTSIEQIKGTLNLALATTQTKTLFIIQHEISDMHQSFANHAHYAELRDYWARIDPPDFRKSHLQARQKWQPNTCNWFLKAKRYLCWRDWSSSDSDKDQARPWLWLHGQSGCGKTVLYSSVIEDLVGICRRQSSTEQRAIVLYFYFDSVTTDCTLLSLLKSWICQILTQLPSKNRYWQNSSIPIGARTTVVDLVSDFYLLLTYCGRVYGVIDALNECEDFRGLITWLEDINQNRIHVRFLCTSHYMSGIEQLTSSMCGEAFAIPHEQLLNDIKIYLEERLSSDIKLQQWPLSLRNEVRDSMIRNAKDGVFRWVDCQLESLRAAPNPKAVKLALTRSPQSLDEFYVRVLSKIEEDDVQDVHNFLQWLVLSVQPLSVCQVCEALAIDWTTPQEPIFDASLRPFDKFRIVDLCSSLVTVDTVQPGAVGDAQNMLLRLAHPSVRKFLLTDIYDPESLAGDFDVFLGSGHAAMARVCMTYRLQFEAGSEGPDADQYPLAQYAASHWAYHLLRARRTARDNLETLAWPFFDEDAPHFQTWFRFFDINRRCGRTTQLLERRQKVTPLYCASSLGLIHVCQRLLRGGADPAEASEDGLWSTPLNVATVYKYDKICEVLRKTGARPEESKILVRASATDQREHICRPIYKKRSVDFTSRGGSRGDDLKNTAIVQTGVTSEPSPGAFWVETNAGSASVDRTISMDLIAQNF